MKQLFVSLRTKNPKIESHERFLEHIDNLVLALVGIPAALAFGRLVVSWTANAIMTKNWLQWFATGVAVVVLFNLLAIMFGLFTFVTINWKSYREEISKSYISFLAYPLFLTAIVAFIVMGMVAGSDSAGFGISVQATLSMTGFGMALCLLMISLNTLTILLMPDIFQLANDADSKNAQASPVDALFIITYGVVFIALLLARLTPLVFPFWQVVWAKIA